MIAEQLQLMSPKETRGAQRMESVIFGSWSSPLIARLLSLKFPDGDSCLDLTWGAGSFWNRVVGWDVIGFDHAAKPGTAARASFDCLPVRDAAVDVAVFDPPYLSDRRGNWLHSERYGQLGDESLSSMLPRVAAEIRRVSRLGCIVKVQDVMDGYKALWHSHAVFDAFRAIGFEPTEQIVFVPSGGRIDGWNWDRQFSVRRVHSYFFVFEWAPRRRAKDRALTDNAETAAPRGAAPEEVGALPS